MDEVMKLYAPAYYQNFTCIADKCTHSCCVGWEIDIDPHTVTVYRGLSGDYCEEIRQSVDDSGDTPHFRLCHGERCPHLDESGLCRIITSLGEDYLCDICREHPRFYNQTSRGLEVGLGMACEEAARIILSSDGYANITEIEASEGEPESFDFDPLPYRAKILDVLQDPALTYPQKEQALEQLFGVTLACRADAEWRDLLSELEYLDEGHRAVFAESFVSNGQLPHGGDAILTRALAYFIYRHVTAAYDPDELCGAVGFGMLCVRLMASLWHEGHGDLLTASVECGRTVSEELEYSEENTQAIKDAFGW